MPSSPDLMPDGPLLIVRDLKAYFPIRKGPLVRRVVGHIKAVDGVDLSVNRARTLCVVGESGCGKSVMALAALRIVQEPGRIVSGKILWNGNVGQTQDIAALNPKGQEIRAIRGDQISMIFAAPFGPSTTATVSVSAMTSPLGATLNLTPDTNH